MSYQALYRSWRPQTFADLVGQPHVKQTLTNALERQQVAHAYLFCGPRGTGKTSAAKILAKAVNCLEPSGVEPCNHCSACESIVTGNSVDVEEIDAASNRGVDEIRQLREKVQYAPASLRRKVYIVDEVHMLTTEAFNALLKTLEEPPGHTLFILATTEPHKIPGTIVSRCQRFDFRRISPEMMMEHLKHVCNEEGWTWEEDALLKVSEAADGGLRDALGLLEQTAAFGQGNVTAESAAHVVGGVETTALLSLVEALVSHNLLQTMNMLMEWYAAGKDPSRIVHEILQLLRDLFIVKLSSGTEADVGNLRRAHRAVAERLSVEWLLNAVKQLGETYTNLRFVDQPRLALEASLLSLAPVSTVNSAAATVTAQTGSHQSAVPAQAEQHQGTVLASDQTAKGLSTEESADAGSAVESAANADRPSSTSNSSNKVARAAARRNKMEVLKDLAREASEDVLSTVQENWAAILQHVKTQRIQTYAWLMNGQTVLATQDVVVLAFSSQIHRDAVMKPDERSSIESALTTAVGRPIQIVALLKSDWEKFTESLQPVEQNTGNSGLVEQTIQVFGKELVEIIDEE